MTDGLSIFAASGAGFISFFAPCILPLIPPYFAWMLKISQNELGELKIRMKLFRHGLLLMLGFAIVFITLGASASSLGQMLAPHRLLLQKIGGILFIVFGLELLGTLKFLGLFKTGFVQKIFARANSTGSSFLAGSFFAAAWIACFSPILGSILVLSSFQETVWQGIILLSFYTIGLSIPFLAVSLLMGAFAKRMGSLARLTRWINKLSGVILILIGILFVTDTFYKLVSWFAQF